MVYQVEPLSHPMIIDLFGELFDVCRNGCIPALKLLEAMEDLGQKKAITAVAEDKRVQWREDVSAAVFTYINFNESLKSLIRL